MSRKKIIKEEIVKATAPVVLPDCSSKEWENIINEIEENPVESIVPGLSSRFIAKLGTIDPFLIISVDATQTHSDSDYQQVEVHLRDCPHGRKCLNEFVNSLPKKTTLQKIFGMEIKDTGIDLNLTHLDPFGKPLTETVYRNVSDLSISTSCSSTEHKLDLSTIILYLKFKTLELR